MKKSPILSILCFALGAIALGVGIWTTQTEETQLSDHFHARSFDDSEASGKSKISFTRDSSIHLSWNLQPGYEYPYVGWLWHSKQVGQGCFDAHRLTGLKIQLVSPSQPGSWFFINAKTHNPAFGNKLFRQSAHADGKSQILELEHFVMPEWFAVENKIQPDQQTADWQYLCSLEVLIQNPNPDQGSLEIQNISLIYDRGKSWPWFAGAVMAIILGLFAWSASTKSAYQKYQTRNT